MSQSSYFESRLDQVILGELEGEIRDLGKSLEWRDRYETWREEALGPSGLVTSAIGALVFFLLQPNHIEKNW